MIFWFLRKLTTLVPTLIGASLVAFFLIRWVPGDPVLNILGERGGSAEMIAEMRHSLGLDLPVWTQYFQFVKKAVTGDLGTSIVTKTAVAQEFSSRFPATVELSLMAFMWAVILGIPLGILAALRRNTWLDYSVIGVSLAGYSMPIFWWGLILIMIFSVKFGLTPVSGRMAVAYDIPTWTGFMLIDVWKSDAPWEAFVSALRHLILPSIVLATVPLATIGRMTRSSLLEVMGEDYIKTARAKGLPTWRVVLVHGLRNALIPVVTVVGLLAGTIITGAVLTESIFSWPGLGQWMVASVLQRDYPVIQGGVLMIAGLVMSVNLFVDIIYLWVNPRLRGH